MISKIELLAPAGSKEALDAAIGEGADAVYLGLKDFNARKRAKNFSYKELEAIIDRLHKINKKVYVALNTIVEEKEINQVYNILKYLNIIKPDALIIQDFGIVKLVNDFFPELKIHASTQMNIGSASGINYLSKLNIKRVVLSRELDFNQIKKIRQNTNLELEIFVHGALCISASGLCLFSSYIGGRSANRGTCAQPCRKIYNTMDKYGYFFSTKDLMLAEHLPDIIDSGINSIKLEGRMRNAGYVATIVRAYRYIIDNYETNKDDAVKKALSILQNDFARNKTSYYFSGKAKSNLLEEETTGGTGIFLGKIKKIKIIDGKKYGLINPDADISVNDTVRINAFRGKNKQNIKITEVISDKNGILINIADNVNEQDNVYLIGKKELTAKYNHIIPKSFTKYKHHPSISPMPKNKKPYQKIRHYLKNGLYIKISNFKDIYTTQSFKPEKLIIDLNKYNLPKLRSELKSTTYSNDDIILYLSPFFNYEDELILKENLKYLINDGFQYFIANNIGQLNLLKQNNLNIIAGHYLYTFNSFAINQFDELGASYFINPVENNKRNLIESYSDFKDRVIIPLFIYPELFQIQTNLSYKYNLNSFKDKFENKFSMIKEDERTIILPERPFSIFDKIPFLKKSGFNKYLIDLSYTNINKNFYKNIVRSYNFFENPVNTTRFNWKDGFYKEDFKE